MEMLEWGPIQFDDDSMPILSRWFANVMGPSACRLRKDVTYQQPFVGGERLCMVCFSRVDSRHAPGAKLLGGADLFCG